MARSDPYFTFPIKLLRCNCHPKQLSDDGFDSMLDAIVVYAIGYMIEQADVDNEETVGIAEKELHHQPNVADCDDDDAVRLLWAARSLGVKLHTDDVSYYTNKLTKVDRVGHGKTMVRLRTNILWDVRQSRCLTPMQFMVLCSVCAAIGDNKVRRVTRARLVALSTGLSGKDELAKFGPKKRIEEHQVRTALDTLGKRGFFVRVCVNRRHTWFSNSMSESELIEAVAKQEAKRPKRMTNSQKAEAVKRRIEQIGKAGGKVAT
jgi:hypothetical protein